MTKLTSFKKFLAAIPRTGWVVNHYGKLRRGRKDSASCPITSLDGTPGSAVVGAAANHGIPKSLRDDIIRAADCSESSLVGMLENAYPAYKPRYKRSLRIRRAFLTELNPKAIG